MAIRVPDENPMQAASYERVSSDEQAREGFSLEVQAEKNTLHIKNQGWALYDRYIDAGKSAKNLKRPDMQRLLSDIDARKVNVVVVHKLDRLTRNVGDLHELLSLFERKEIKLVSISENIDTSSAMGRMFVYMLGIFAQWYRENLSEEVIKGQRKRAENGLRNSSSRPYGYNVSPEDLSLTINEEEAPIVVRMFEQFVNGWGKRKIAIELNNEGIPAMRGGIWYESVVGPILTNPTYIGAVHWNERAADDSERVITYDVHEPIISKELWDEAQIVSERRKEGVISSSSYDFPYSTIVKCGECGRSYHGKMQSRRVKSWSKPLYRCSGKYRMNPCDAKDIKESSMDELFLNFLESFTFEPVQPATTMNEKDSAKEVKRLTKLIEESETKRKNYTRAMGSGKIEYELYEELVDEEDRKVKPWREELARLQQVTNVSVRTAKDIVSRVDNLKLNWAKLDRLQRKITIQKLFEVLVIKKVDGEWEITGYKLA